MKKRICVPWNVFFIIIIIIIIIITIITIITIIITFYIIFCGVRVLASPFGHPTQVSDYLGNPFVQGFKSL